jgi:hypothetical protein
MTGFAFKLELPGGTPADPATLFGCRAGLASRRHDPARPRQDAPRRRYPVWNGTGRRPGSSSWKPPGFQPSVEPCRMAYPNLPRRRCLSGRVSGERRL